MSATLSAVYPVLMARDVEHSIAFYVRLGFVEAFRDDAGAPRYAVVRRGPAELHLQWADPSQAEVRKDYYSELSEAARELAVLWIPPSHRRIP